MLVVKRLAMTQTLRCRRIGVAALICFAALTLRGIAVAQAVAPTVALAQIPAATVPAAEKPTVVSFDPTEIQLGKSVALLIPDLDTIKDKDHPDPTQAILYINGHPITDAHARRDGNKLVFDLQESSESGKTWTSVLGSPDSLSRDVDLTVGFSDGTKWPSKAHGKIVVVPLGWFWFCVIFLALLLIVFGYLAVNSNILRDVEPEPGNDQKKTLSLSRVQMAIWFFVVLGAFLLIWSITGATSISTTALTLMGISLGTGLAATVVDSNKRTAAKTQVDTLTAERGDIIKRIEQLRPAITAVADVVDEQGLQSELNERTARLAAVNNQLTSVRNSLAPMAAQGVALDLLTDANGAALHRFQLAAWTLVLAVIFLHRVYTDLAMPELDGTLLALMGISNGTYIGFKVPEKQA